MMNDRFLRACHKQPVDATPVWFMRQAGRYMPEYRVLREKYSMLQLCRTPELAAQVTLQPLRLGVDAAILFADILLPLEPMGAPFDFAKGEGPVIANPVRSRADIDRLRLVDPQESLGYVLETIRRVREHLTVPLIGFAGAPFTLASYLIEGGKSSQFALTKKLMLSDPDSWDVLLRKLTEVIRRFLRAQIEAGAQAVQVFDSWVGQLSADQYNEHVASHMCRLFEDLAKCGVPTIHFGTGTAGLLECMAATGGSVFGLDWRVRLSDGWARVGLDRAVQGNLDPVTLLAPRKVIQARTSEVLAFAHRRPGHIFNVGHGLLPDTPVDEVKALVDFVHEQSQSTS
jgi:uroporphyrinogen decarboxylase